MHPVIQGVARAPLIALAIMALEWVLGLALPTPGATAQAAGFVDRYLLPFTSLLLLAAPLAYPIGRSRLRGGALWGSVFLAVLGLMTVLTHIEAAVFLSMTPGELGFGVLRATIVSGALSWLAVVLYPRLEAVPAPAERRANPPSRASWVRRWIGVSFAYLLLYVTAGILILPLIRAWYEAQGRLPPGPQLLIPLQLFRGALYVAFVLPLLRSMSVSRWQASLAMAVMIPLVHGVAALIRPNPLMPGFVRHAHLIEIGWSNFVLGLLIGFLFWNPGPNGALGISPRGGSPWK
jgi:hypothetical protein